MCVGVSDAVIPDHRRQFQSNVLGSLLLHGVVKWYDVEIYSHNTLAEKKQIHTYQNDVSSMCKSNIPFLMKVACYDSLSTLATTSPDLWEWCRLSCFRFVLRMTVQSYHDSTGSWRHLKTVNAHAHNDCQNTTEYSIQQPRHHGRDIRPRDWRPNCCPSWHTWTLPWILPGHWNRWKGHRWWPWQKVDIVFNWSLWVVQDRGWYRWSHAFR